MDLRYEWAVQSDARARGPPGSPAPDAQYFLSEYALASNSSARPADSLQYYVAALEASALNATSQTFVAGGEMRYPSPAQCCPSRLGRLSCAFITGQQ